MADVKPLHPLNRWRSAVLSEHGPSQPGARLVALAVSKFVNSESLSTYVSAGEVTKVTAMGDRAVRSHLLLLLSEGWLTATPIRRGNGWKLRLFTLQLPAGVPANSAGTDPDAAAKNDRSTGKKRQEYRQILPTNSDSELCNRTLSADGAAAPEGAAPTAPRRRLLADEHPDLSPNGRRRAARVAA